MRGFSLLEVLAAFTVLSLFVTAAFQAFSVGADVTERYGDHIRAQMLARSTLETLAAGRALAPGEKKGQVVLDGSDRIFRWRAVIADYELPGSRRESPHAPLRAIVEVTWGDAAAYGSFELNALLLGAPR